LRQNGRRKSVGDVGENVLFKRERCEYVSTRWFAGSVICGGRLIRLWSFLQFNALDRL
jgi:hypothetical protein